MIVALSRDVGADIRQEAVAVGEDVLGDGDVED